MTTYDELYEAFLIETDFNTYDLPQTDDARYLVIKKAIANYNRYAKKYNERLQGNVRCSDVEEMLSVSLSNDEMLVVVYMMAEIIAIRSYTAYSSIYSTYAKELGVSNYTATASARQNVVQLYQNKYMSIIEDQIDSFELD